MQRHPQLNWIDIENILNNSPSKIKALYEMERTGGEPDIVILDELAKAIIFYDCSAESPKLRRSLCCDREALDNRKDHAPENNVMDMVKDFGAELLTEEEYRALQNIFDFDLKTSSWIITPQDIRNQGGATFCDSRYGYVFTCHNGAKSYYASRRFHSKLIISCLR